ncbi:YciI family protein [Nocardia sp. alder85J]|uniref:YciI family protein n=1 Tax=Nocardia sp. alder85J TaxID=2862949 RepID=UPI001CD56256|nr:YciI family protein [Nocardia sp. alder85J]MCX4091194.1 YciI family protein [Nocardia sp. alder85J]
MYKYLVLALRTPDWTDAVAEPHRDWLAEVRSTGNLDCTGRFTDGTGGAYVILAENLDAARELVATDPIHTSGASELVVFEWEITG